MTTDIPMLLDWLRQRNMTVAFAESCTGGLLAERMTSVPGASDVICGSAVCYQITAKQKVLGIRDVTEENVVSYSTAVQMAARTVALFGSSIGIATTGYLDGVHFEKPPHAYWAIHCGILSPIDLKLDYNPLLSYVEFPNGSSREQNRFLMVAVVLGALAEIFRRNS